MHNTGASNRAGSWARSSEGALLEAQPGMPLLLEGPKLEVSPKTLRRRSFPTITPKSEALGPTQGSKPKSVGLGIPSQREGLQECSSSQERPPKQKSRSMWYSPVVCSILLLVRFALWSDYGLVGLRMSFQGHDMRIVSLKFVWSLPASRTMAFIPSQSSGCG